MIAACTAPLTAGGEWKVAAEYFVSEGRLAKCTSSMRVTATVSGQAIASAGSGEAKYSGYGTTKVTIPADCRRSSADPTKTTIKIALSRPFDSAFFF